MLTYLLLAAVCGLAVANAVLIRRYRVYFLNLMQQQSSLQLEVNAMKHVVTNCSLSVALQKVRQEWERAPIMADPVIREESLAFLSRINDLSCLPGAGTTRERET